MRRAPEREQLPLYVPEPCEPPRVRRPETPAPSRGVVTVDLTVDFTLDSGS